MYPFTRTAHLILLLATVVCLSIPIAQAAQPLDSCSLLTKAEIQDVFGQSVGDGKLNTKANPMGGIPCEYKVGASGVFSMVFKQAAPGENADKVTAELKKMKIAVSEAPGIGDRSFFSSPGYGMVQLNTFKGKSYLIITMLVPGATEAAQRAAAEKLIRKALTRI